MQPSVGSRRMNYGVDRVQPTIKGLSGAELIEQECDPLPPLQVD